MANNALNTLTNKPSQYNPSFITLLLLQSASIGLYGFCTDYSPEMTNQEITTTIDHYYPFFQDVHVMIFIGFGFLMTFLKRYSHSALGYTMFLS